MAVSIKEVSLTVARRCSVNLNVLTILQNSQKTPLLESLFTVGAVELKLH